MRTGTTMRSTASSLRSATTAARNDRWRRDLGTLALHRPLHHGPMGRHGALQPIRLPTPGGARPILPRPPRPDGVGRSVRDGGGVTWPFDRTKQRELKRDVAYPTELGDRAYLYLSWWAWELTEGRRCRKHDEHFHLWRDKTLDEMGAA